MPAQRPRKEKLKIYAVLIAVITAGTIAFSALTSFVSYPTVTHRDVSRKLSEYDRRLFSEPDKYDAIINSDKYKNLLNSQASVYSQRMSLGSSILEFIISVAIIVAVYRYLRRNTITSKPVGATVFINTVTAILAAVPLMFVSQALTGYIIDSVTLIILLVASPFIIGFTILFVFIVTKITEWQYNRSQGLAKE